MYFSKREGDQASEIQRSTVTAWYAAICFAICLAGAIWLAILMGLIDFGGETNGLTGNQAAAKAAAQKAAAQQVQARQAAEEEARNIAEDSKRLIKGPEPTPPTDPAASAPATPIAPVATSTAAAKALDVPNAH